MKICVTCGKMTKEFVEFPCAECGKKIIRCRHCKEIKNPYACECGFKGP